MSPNVLLSFCLALVILALIILALIMVPVQAATTCQYVSSDPYTRYELLTPDSHQFRIYYEVTETKPGAKFHFNPIREGSQASDESVIDLATGKPLRFEEVSGSDARGDSAGERLNPNSKYIKVHLARPVPANGECRIAIYKTYKDEASYYQQGDLIVFKRSLSIPRNSVVLPPGYELVYSSIAVQVITEPDRRLKLAFVNSGSGGALEVTIRARPITGK